MGNSDTFGGNVETTPATDEEESDESEMSEKEKRAKLIDMLEVGMDEAHRKVESGRVRDADNEKVRQGWVRALGYLGNTYRQAIRDKELEELAEEMEELREKIEGDG